MKREAKLCEIAETISFLRPTAASDNRSYITKPQSTVPKLSNLSAFLCDRRRRVLRSGFCSFLRSPSLSLTLSYLFLSSLPSDKVANVLSLHLIARKQQKICMPLRPLKEEEDVCSVQRSAKVNAPGCVNSAGKLGQKLADPCTPVGRRGCPSSGHY